MKMIFKFALFGPLSVLFSGLYAQESEVKGSLFIIGGGARPQSMVERIISEAGLDKDGYAVILPMASTQPDSAVFYAKKQFAEAGLQNVFGFRLGETPVTAAELDSLCQAKLIYISGGDQSLFMSAIENTPIPKVIAENYYQGGMIAGTSAGAAVMSLQMITGKEKRHPGYNATFRHLEKDNLELEPGLGLIPNVIIDQHFVRRSRYNRLISAVLEHPQITGIGIDEATAILYRKGHVEVVGESQVIVFKNPSRTANDNGVVKLTGKGLTIDIYLNGERFILD